MPCESPACPCYATPCGSVEMEAAAAQWRSRPSVAAARSFLRGEDAVEIIEHRAWLDLMAAIADVEIVHESRSA